MSFAPYAKAIVAFLVPGAVSIQAAMADASPGGSAITLNEWIGAGILCVTTSGLVWAVPNQRAKAPADTAPSTYVTTTTADPEAIAQAMERRRRLAQPGVRSGDYDAKHD